MKYLFFDDYSEGAHPRILEALAKTNLVQEIGYGGDHYCQAAADLVKERIHNPHSHVHFLTGGTQANLVVLASMLRPHESVMAPQTSHIHVHETGAIEATGHKIELIHTDDGKITPKQVVACLGYHEDEHMVKPRVVFVSQSTEVGTIYKKSELEAISDICKQRDLYLYLDGARLGSALTSTETDISLPELSSLVDVFYIGGTKNGALLGEAVVINNPALQADFRYLMKQRGALLAKGRLIGIQFLELFRDDLFFDLARHANAMAGILTDGLVEQGYKLFSKSTTNQVFPILPKSLVEKLQKEYGFYPWTPLNDKETVIRLVTSWATKEEAVNEFLSDVQAFG